MFHKNSLQQNNLRKFKDFQDAEATIVCYEEGKGKRSGTLGKFLMQDDDGNQFLPDFQQVIIRTRRQGYSKYRARFSFGRTN